MYKLIIKKADIKRIITFGNGYNGYEYYEYTTSQFYKQGFNVYIIKKKKKIIIFDF